MKLESGHFNIFPLLEYVAEHPMPPLKSKKGKQGEYAKLIQTLLERSAVPQRPGWYLWGKFNRIGWWETIYLGKAASLKTRLYDELREESNAIWSTVWGYEIIEKFSKRIWPKFVSQLSRSFRKSGTHFIIWIAHNSINYGKVKERERALIQFFRPAYNIQRLKIVNYDDATKMIISEIELSVKQLKKQK